MSSTGIARGRGKGFQVTRVEKRTKVAANKGKLGPRTAVVREVAREVCGFAPYEKKVIELLNNELDKRALRLAKKRLGSFHRGKRKREELAGVAKARQIAKAKKAQAKAAAEQH
eukprot:TRINITY_DN2529_c0_g1_i1.p1 TRINITY_DN2529_c0_g1~~TRINITY_DN2529_c0_g1_i1.p1  ORF type:complete len:114 (-),score=33.58 TRINITY_DN2529_c0_g1_i1:78-419(-)